MSETRDVEEQLAGLTAEQKQDLLRRLLAGQTAARTRRFPLSFAQQRLWVLDQLEGGLSVAYNMPLALRLVGPLDVAALERAFAEVTRRHDVLRTTFELDVSSGQPVQVVHPSRGFALDSRDLRGEPDPERAARSLADQEATRPFDLSAGPMLRAALLRLSEDEHVLLYTMHHIVCDGWSLDVLVRELSELYEAYAAGRESPLPKLPIQYADFAHWQRQRLSGELLENQLAYWRERLGGHLPVLELPTKDVRPARHTSRGAVLRHKLGRELDGNVKTLAQRSGATPFMVLLAAFQLLLRRYTNQVDVLLGTPIANRTRRELESLIGFFVNTLVLRADLSGDPPFLALLGRVREACLGAYAHQDVPFERLVEELAPERDLSRTPLFQVMFALQNDPPRKVESGSMTLLPFETESVTAKFDLTMVVSQSESGLDTTWEYNTNLFDEESVGRMSRHYERLLREAVAHPTERVTLLPMLADEEEREILALSSQPRVGRAEDATLHELFERQAARTPAAVALRHGAERLTYAELDERATRLARRLRRLGVGPDALVGLLAERSLEMVVGLLGILKAGGAYVPLDPEYPRDRLAFMLEDAGVRVLLAQRERLGDLSATAAEVVYLDEACEEAADESEVSTRPKPCGKNLAYVIYTSGSTGRPKGVLVTHENVVRLFSATDEWFHFGPQDVWTLFHSYAFDFSVWELWGALLYGGRLVVVPYVVSRSPEAFHRLLSEEGVTVLNQTPSAFRHLMRADESQPHERLSLRLVIFGGEALDLPSLRPWFERHGDERPQLVNMYGITETTVHVTYRPLRREDARDGSGSLIGRPIPDLQLYVLNARCQLLPLGVPGELYVGGEGVARGYLNRPELTAERFVPNPLSTEPGARLYRTGDRARRLPGGDVEYLGRVDHQIKIRGFRIELGEIEMALAEHESVLETVVLLREDAPGDKRLVAYFAHADGQAPDSASLRRFLKEKLPEYMIPAAFIALDALPLTPNGKVDRKALPVPGGPGTGSPQEFVAPRPGVEQTLSDIWAEVLGVEGVGAGDNFFALGGDSIKVIRAVSRARQAGLDISLPQFFKHQTLRSLAEDLDGAAPFEPDGASRREPFAMLKPEDRALLPEGVGDAYPLAMLQEGMLFHSAYDSGSTTYHNVSSVHLRAPLDFEALRAAVARLVARHDVLRTSFDLAGFSEPLQLVHESVETPLKTDDLRGLSEAEQEEFIGAWVEEEKRRFFDWGRAPLIRFHVHRRGEETFQFTATEHHAILDGWSVATMLTELFGTYLSLVGVQPGEREEGAAGSFGDFVKAERDALASEESRAFWRDFLADGEAGRLPRLPPSYRDEGARQEKRVLSLTLPEEVSEGLRRLSQSARVPLKSVLLAAHLRALGVILGRSDVLTGVVSHGRSEGEDGDRTLGLFLNTLPFRLRLDGGTWLELVRRAFEAEQAVLPFRHYPLAQIQREAGGRPLFESAFNFTHFHVYQDVLARGGVEVLGGTGYAETNYPFWATFSVDLATSQVVLVLKGEAALTAAQMECFADVYLNALAAMARDPRGRYDALSLLSPEWEARLLREWNDTAADYGAADFTQLFEERAAAHPDRVAVEGNGVRLTYEELARRAARLAEYLRSVGVGPEARVGLLTGRTPAALTGVLGILKAGGAFVPLDPEHPRERLSFIIEDAGVSLVLTEGRLKGLLSGARAEVLCLDADWRLSESARLPDGSKDGSEDVPHAFGGVTPGNLAYVIYTSGSTGRPKGVAVARAGLVNYLAWLNAHPIGEEEVALPFITKPSFDPSFRQFLAPLLRGSAVWVVDENAASDPRALVDELSTREGAGLSCVPSLWQTILEQVVGEQSRAALAKVKTLMLGGEAVPQHLVESTFRLLPDLKLWNLYGPTEVTVNACAARLSPSREVTVGRPVANARLYVLDSFLQPLPVGVAGELYVGGAGLARGYQGRAGLTAESFIPNPFAEQPGARLYRTGDVARWLADGQIEFLGRLDQQVKIRGYRIEPGEIEQVLSAHPSVSSVVVEARAADEGEMKLVCYVVPARGQSVSESELRRTARERLPDYMVPSAFVFLDELPLNANGKLDRARLPEPEIVGREGTESFTPPRDLLELQLAQIWEEVLQVRPVGVTESFFNLGGHSLSAVRLMARVNRRFRRELPISTLMERQTVAGIAVLLRQVPRASEVTPLVAIRPGGSKRPFFAVHPVGGNVLCYAELARLLGAERPFYGLQSTGMHEGEEPPGSVEEMAARYVEAVRAVQPAGPYALSGWSMGGVVAFEMARQLMESGQEVSLLALIDSKCPDSRARQQDEPGEVDLAINFLLDLAATYGVEVPALPEDFRRRDPDEQLLYLFKQAEACNVVPPDAEPSYLRRLFEVFKANARAARRYAPRPAGLPITLFKAVQPWQSSDFDDAECWRAFTSSAVEVRRVAGTHYTLLRQPYVAEVAEQLNAALTGEGDGSVE